MGNKVLPEWKPSDDEWPALSDPKGGPMAETAREAGTPVPEPCVHSGIDLQCASCLYSAVITTLDERDSALSQIKAHEAVRDACFEALPECQVWGDVPGHIEALKGERDAARAALVDMDIIGRRENKDPSRREWWSGGTWLYRNQVVAVVELPAAPKDEGGSK